MALNGWGAEKRLPVAAPVTLPVIEFADIDIEREAKEAARVVAERKIVRQGVDAWQAIGKADSFEAWKTIGKALQVGRNYALKATGANRPEGRTYCREFSAWVRKHGFERMQKSVRSTALELHENILAIEAWRNTLDERTRKSLIHPLSVTRRWKASLAHGHGKCPQDLKRDAAAAWKRFVSCVEALPTSEALPLWRLAQEQAAARQTR